MSEYQYYEFMALDRRLTEKEMDQLRQLSSRAEITPTSFTNTYHYGDFRGDPRKMMEKYFDAFVYVANWGTRRFVLRLPLAAIDLKVLSQYNAEESFDVAKAGEHVILEWCWNDEGEGDWEEGEGWLSKLLPIRDALLEGDLRSLYIGWLLGVELRAIDDDAQEPPVPPGLSKLPASLKALTGFLRIEPALLAVAAERSAAMDDTPVADQELQKWVGKLSAAEKDKALFRALQGDGAQVRQELLKQFRNARKLSKPARKTEAAVAGRTAAELRAAAGAHAAEQERISAEKTARKNAERERAQLQARIKHLDSLGPKIPHLWEQVGQLLQSTRPADYDQVVELLKDLRDFADRAGNKSDVHRRIDEIRSRFSKRAAFLRRLRAAGL